MLPHHHLSSVPIPCLVCRERRWQFCPHMSKILERGWRVGRRLAQPVAAPPAAKQLPVPSQSASWGERSRW